MTVPVLAVAALLSLSSQTHQSQTPAPEQSNAPALSARFDADAPQQRRVEERERTSGERPHAVGLGSQLSLSNRGAGAGGRFWFGDRLGVNIDGFWYKPRYTIAGQQPGSTYGVFPSFVVMLKSANLDADIDVRPYVGGGISYVSGPRVVTTFNGPVQFQRTNGTGGQAFGGVEMTFKEADWMTISAEGIYYRLPVRMVNSAVVDGFNYLLAFHFYLK